MVTKHKQTSPPHALVTANSNFVGSINLTAGGTPWYVFHDIRLLMVDKGSPKIDNVTLGKSPGTISQNSEEENKRFFLYKN